jgi:hypothetical protein
MARSRLLGVRLLVVGALLLGALVVPPEPVLAAETRASAEMSFVDKLNAERRSRGLSALTVDVELTRVARDWSAKMREQNRLYHRPDLTQRVTSDWSRLGENVGRTSGGSESELVDRLHRTFMGSSGHRQNILGDFNHVGVGVRRGADGTLWVTVNFMRAPTARGHTAVAEGVRVSRSLFARAGADGRNARHVVLARAEVFADSLGGMALAGDRGPMLFTPGPRSGETSPVLHPASRAEIDRILGRSGTVYLLGGEQAVSARAADELKRAGYTVRRLGGEDRIATALAVARELEQQHGRPGEVLIATSRNWADAVSGGAYAARNGVPVLLTPAGALDPRVARYLDEARPGKRYVLGGRAALSDNVLQAAGGERVSGPDRSATSVAIAERMWGRTSGSPGDRFVVAHGYHRDGWALALANGPRAAIYSAPQLLVADHVPGSVSTYLSSLGYEPGRAATLEIIGVNGTVQTQLNDLAGNG